jgi:hypothetical protein
MRSTLAVTCLGLALGVVACGGGAAMVRADAAVADAGVDATAGGDGGEAGGSCTLAPTGQFTFHVHNAGTSNLIVDLGCGATSPFTLDSPAGTLGAGPGNADTCELSCDKIYAGLAVPGGCTDCGGGVQRTLAPGYTVDVPWDRRLYVERAVDPQCSANASGMCALGIAVAPTTTQKGTVTTCPVDQHPTGSCLQPLITTFTVDTTGLDATVDVGP